MKIKFNYPEEHLNQHIQDILGGMDFTERKLTIQSAELLELKQESDLLFARCAFGTKIRNSLFTSPALKLQLRLDIKLELEGQELKLRLIAFRLIDIKGFNKRWHQKVFAGLFSELRPIVLGIINKELAALTLNWKNIFRRALLPGLETPIRNQTGWGLEELDIELLSLEKQIKKDLWFEFDSRSIWRSEPVYSKLDARLLPTENFAQGQWKMQANEQVAEHILKRLIPDMKLPQKLTILGVHMGRERLGVDFRLESPAKLNLNWSAGIEFGEEGFELKEPKMQSLDGKKSWREMLALPGIRLLMNRALSKHSSMRYSELNGLLNERIQSAIESKNDLLQVQAGLEIVQMQWTGDQVNAFIGGTFVIRRLY